MNTFYVGNGQWELSQAILNANDGDVIRFIQDYNYLYSQNDSIVIDKNLTLQGIYDYNTRNINTTLSAPIIICNNSKVFMDGIWFNTDHGFHAVQITEESELNCNFVAFNTTVNNDYDLIRCENNSILNMKESFVQSNINIFPAIVINDSQSNFTDCIFNTFIYTTGSDVSINSSTITNTSGNVLNFRNSVITVNDSKIEGGNTQKNFPCVWLSGSSLTSLRSTYLQPQYNNCINMINHSFLNSDSDSFSSIHCENGTLDTKNSSITECLGLYFNSYLYSHENLYLYCQSQSAVPLHLGGYSTVVAESIMYQGFFIPNYRLEEHSTLIYDQIVFPEHFFELQFDVYPGCTSICRTSIYSEEEADELENTEIYNDSEFPLPHSPLAEPESMENTKSELEQLNELTGLKSVKEEINKILSVVEFNRKRAEQGLKPQKQVLHSVFMGNPGTGKTTVARLIGKILFDNGVFPGNEFIFVEANESDLIASFVGGTAQQTAAILEKAKGGILFIDEAYTLNKKDSNVNFGQEAINTILKYMEDHRDEIMIIFAGYTKEMEQFLKTNPGLSSRVPNKFIFDDFSPDEIIHIGEKIISDNQYVLEDRDFYIKKVESAYKRSLDKSNARWIRNFNDMLFRSLANRIVEENSEDTSTIKNRDIEDVLNKNKYQDPDNNVSDAFENLNNLIGIQNVKQKVQEFIALAKVNKLREDQGNHSNDFSFHSMFTGNPGTGKTTVARLMGDILYQHDLIDTRKFIEVTGGDLIAGYMGQTQQKTREVLESALGGILFIDEAYTLSQDERNYFASEAITEIIKFMEDHRRDIVIIFAGYTDEMNKFFRMNPGIRSRVPHVFEFEDYTPEQMVKIGLINVKNSGYQVNEEEYGKLVNYNMIISNDRSNGRWVRNLNEKLFTITASRISNNPGSDLNVITSEDIFNAMDK